MAGNINILQLIFYFKQE